jgi:S1-C subfamily serine protease
MSSEVQKFSDDLAAAVEKAAFSTVSVDARHHVPASGIVWSANGEILTAAHVLQRDDHIGVTLSGGKTYQAKLLGRDDASDLALLKIEAAGLAAPELVETGVKVGHLVFAVGRPDDVQATLGSVVAVGGAVYGRRRHISAYIQTDVTMYPGFSGGPLVDASGRVLGLNSSALARGASLAIPVPAARGVADALRRDGRVQHGFLGISTQPVELSDTLADQLKQQTGLMIIGAEKGSPAEKGGILQGDVLVDLNSQVITDIYDLQAALGPETVGKPISAKVIRGGEVKELKVTPAARE